jgi:hypothetical protein
MYIIATWVVPSNTNDAGTQYSFVAVWSGLLVLGFGIGGTLVLKKYTTPLALGFMIGMSFMMANLMLFMATMSAGDMADAISATAGKRDSSQTAVCTFSCFLFCCYVFFTLFLVRARSEFLDQFDQHSQITHDELPPPMETGDVSSASLGIGGHDDAIGEHDKPREEAI